MASSSSDSHAGLDLHYQTLSQALILLGDFTTRLTVARRNASTPDVLSVELSMALVHTPSIVLLVGS